MQNSWLGLVTAGVVLCLVQVLAAAPWLLALTQAGGKADRKQLLAAALKTVLAAAAVGASAGLLLYFWQDRDMLGGFGRLYGCVLNVQLILDFFVVVFAVLLRVWPRGGAVAVAAFREGVRQPMYWFIMVAALLMLLLMPFVPYFTFGEDLKMMKELGYDLIMLCAGLFGVLAASMSISEEIEGRTAVTLMSKPVSRRQFLLGKFAGILAAALLMTGLLSIVFFLVLWFKPFYDRETARAPEWLGPFMQSLPALGDAPMYFTGGAAWWFGDAASLSSGLLLGFCQVMVMLAIAVALATRLPMVVNLVVCLVIFFLGHLTPVLATVSQNRYALVRFMAQLFDSLLPGMQHFTLGPAIARDTLPPAGPFSVYLGTVALYATVYTAIALLFGLILFEDRDLA